MQAIRITCNIYTQTLFWHFGLHYYRMQWTVVMHQYQYQTREVNTPYKYILPVFTGAKYKCEIQMYEINANDHHGPRSIAFSKYMGVLDLVFCFRWPPITPWHISYFPPPYTVKSPHYKIIATKMSSLLPAYFHYAHPLPIQTMEGCSYYLTSYNKIC